MNLCDNLYVICKFLCIKKIYGSVYLLVSKFPALENYVNPGVINSLESIFPVHVLIYYMFGY